jgi:hypothetical protein
MLSGGIPYTRGDFIARLPSKAVADRLISRYFMSEAVALRTYEILLTMFARTTCSGLSFVNRATEVIHRPSFLKQVGSQFISQISRESASQFFNSC